MGDFVIGTILAAMALVIVWYYGPAVWAWIKGLVK